LLDATSLGSWYASRDYTIGQQLGRIVAFASRLNKNNMDGQPSVIKSSWLTRMQHTPSISNKLR
jgi:hypothetical protein